MTAFRAAQSANRPKVVRSGRPRVLYYPVRRAASSAIQNALGYDFVDWRYVEGDQYDTFYRFSVYRNTYDRLRSLYYCFVNPAPLGRVDFIDDDIQVPRSTFDAWVRAVCAGDDETCNEHLHSQDWHRIVNGIRIYDMSETQKLAKDINHPIPFFAQTFKHKHRDLNYTDALAELVYNRYAKEIQEFGYTPDIRESFGVYPC